MNKLNESIKILESSVSSNPLNNIKRVKKAIKDFNLSFSDIKTIHVAGTNGKGSVCKYLTEILTDAGLKVGTFVSPYLKVFNERILLNNQNINDDDLLLYLHQILEYNDNLEEKMSFFEMITVMAFKYFFDQAVDVMIIEVGIGGQYDVTNTLQYDLSLLTNVGTDHLDKLGPTIDDVLTNKIGILKPGGILLTTLQEEFHDKATLYAKNVDATIKFVPTANKISSKPLIFSLFDQDFQLKMQGDFQIKNASLSIAAVNYLFPLISFDQIKQSIAKTIWHGRFEIISNDPAIIIDGAHNKEAALALSKAMIELYKNENIVVIMSILKGKDYQSFINLMTTFAKHIILVDFPDPRLADLEQISKQFKIVKHVKNIDKVFDLIKRERNVYLITGSIHFIGYFNNLYNK